MGEADVPQANVPIKHQEKVNPLVKLTARLSGAWHLNRSRPSSWSIFWSLLWNRLKIMTTWPPYMFMVMVLLFIITLFIFHVGYTWIIGAKWKTFEATWSKVQNKHISAGVTEGQRVSLVEFKSVLELYAYFR